MNIHIYSPQKFAARCIRYCTTCKKKRRMIIAFYEWHPIEITCGKCGYKFISGEGRQNVSKKVRKSNIVHVKYLWPQLCNVKTALKKMHEYISEVM